jgi:carboxyl-terminal processing protease
MRKIKIILIHILTLSFITISYANTSRDIYKQVRKNQSLINDVYRHIITNYVDDIDLDAFTKMSINNMLLELDPYTTYMEKEEKDGIEMLTKGKYGGVGIQIGLREKQLTVISPMDQSPAKRAGILSGDKIIKIDGQETEEFNIDDAAKLIRGKKGTEVVLSIQRYGEIELIDFVLTRETIPVKDISYSGMLNENTGYIRLTRFSRNSDKEMKSAIENLLDNQMSDLILDLRDNPGGLLNSAVSILDFFIEKGETLVWTEGKSQKLNRKYTSKTDPILPPDVNIAVLVNQGSASASEIIAGTLQDLDRGIVIGRSTFGKGLVQTVFNIDRERAIKVTTAKYYIPSGRLIQKPGYLPDEILADTVKQDTIFQTKGGRTVSGAGGITPDYEVELDEITPLLSVSWRQGLFFNFIQKHKMNYSSIVEVEKDTSLIYSFEDYLHSNDLDIFMKGERNYLDMKDMLFELDSTSVQIQGALDILDSYFEQIAYKQFDKEKEKLNHYLLVEFADFFSGEEGRIKISSRKDKDIQQALNILNDPVAYERIFLPQ